MDLDADAEISYRFSRSSLPFNLDQISGEIRSSRRLDREEGVAEYSVTVIAQDQGMGLENLSKIKFSNFFFDKCTIKDAQKI